MASSGTFDNHNDALTFVQTKAPAQVPGAFTVTWTSDGKAATVAGVCPACGALTDTEFTPGIGGTKGVFEKILGRGVPAPSQLRSPLTLYCECGHAHTDRPAEAFDKGCGRYWEVNLIESDRQPPAPGPTAP